MAYKFQLGTARLSGSLVQEGQIKAHESKLSGSSIGLGDASGLVESGGGLANADGKLELSMAGMTSAVVDVATDGFYFSDANNGDNIRSGSFLELASGMAGTALNASSGQLSVSGLANAQVASNAAIDFNKLAALTAGNLLVGNASNQAASVSLSGDVSSVSNAGAVTLAAAQTNITSIFNSGLTAIGTANNQEYIDFSNSNEIQLAINDSAMLSVTATGVEIDGNLTVTGTSVEINAGFVVTSSVQFEGSTPDGNEISLTSANPTADRTITLPDLTGHVPLLAGAISNANVTAAEFALLDGGSTVDTATVADGDAVLFNDAGTMKHINVTSLKTYFQSGVTADSAGKIRRTVESTSAGDMEISDDGGVSYFAITASATAVIDPGFSAGHELNIKAGPLVSESVVLTVSGAGGANYTFDGFDTIQLESPNASIKLILRNATDWMIF